jgi:coenzyme F420 biosynthesis associated uncharacterized protein
VIDRGIAERVASAVGGGPGDESPLPADLPELVARSEELVVAYTGLRPAGPLPPPEEVGRAEWRATNLASMAALLDPLADRLTGSGGPLGGALRAGTGLIAGAEAGALVGYLGGRVLGQWDIRLTEPEVPPRLLFVAPNLHHAAKELDADPAQLVAWVCVHEVTHAVQFTGVPWLREHLASLLGELLSTLDVKLDPAAVLRLPSRDDLKALADAVRSGSLVTLVAGEDRMALLDQVQATMALIEGHAEHVMDAAGEQLVGDLGALRTALDRRRRERPPVLAWIERLIGLELKLRQYQDGKAFCDAVVARAGVPALHRAFTGPENLPTLAELADPAGWLRRTDPDALQRGKSAGLGSPPDPPDSGESAGLG